MTNLTQLPLPNTKSTCTDKVREMSSGDIFLTRRYNTRTQFFWFNGKAFEKCERYSIIHSMNHFNQVGDTHTTTHRGEAKCK